ncbi:MAG: hypothetical protein KF878_16135 [Planctomycetes bacterium]|nr:hypothetical protein [Planctomycetota bacterium]
MIKELFKEYAWLGEVALVVAFTAFVLILVQMFLERRSPRWRHDARLPLEEAPPVGAGSTAKEEVSR